MTARSVPQSQRKGPEGLRALDRAVTILWTLAEHPAGLSLAALARETGLTTTTAHRILAALRSKRLVRESADGLHLLGIGTLMLSRPYLEGLELRSEALPHLKALNAEVNEACHLGALASPHIVYIEKLDSTHPVRMVSRVGSTMPAVRTAMGRAILALSSEATVDQVLADSLQQLGPVADEAHVREALERARSLGYATDLEENEPGISCIGAAVRDADGRPIAAISVSSPTARFQERDFDAFAARVVDTAAAISESLGYLAPGRAEQLRVEIASTGGEA